jgi:adenylate cyclase
MLLVFLIVAFLTVILEIACFATKSKKLILDFEREYYSRSVLDTAVKLLDMYPTQLQTILSILAKNYDHKVRVDSTDYDLLFLESIQHIHHATEFFVATKDGEFLSVGPFVKSKFTRRERGIELPDNVAYFIRKIRIDKATKKPIETWAYLDSKLRTVAEETLASPVIIPTKCRWYVEAELNGSGIWSDMYIFNSSRVCGMTLSIPIRYHDHSTAIGVIGVDLIIDQFTDLLKKIKFSKNAKAYLINAKDEIIATSAADIKTFDVDYKTGVVTPIKIIKSGDHTLKEAVNFTFSESSKHREFSIDGIGYIASIGKLNSLPFFLVLIAPQDDLLFITRDVQFDMILASLAVLLLSAIVAIIVSNKIARPVSSMRNFAKKIEELDVDNRSVVQESCIVELNELSKYMVSMNRSLSTFCKYSQKDFVCKLMKQGIQPIIGGKIKIVTILFSDIQNFSVISEDLPAEYLILHLSEYFDKLTKIMLKRNGIIDKYIGDSIMAVWGSLCENSDNSNNAADACMAALECQKILQALDTEWIYLGKPPLPTRIGIHTGPAIAGNIGSDKRMDFTVTGRAVNIAKGLEGANKRYGTKILVSEDTELAARDKILFRIIDRVVVKGCKSSMLVYEPLCQVQNEANEEYCMYMNFCEMSKKAFELYQGMEFRAALKQYEEIAGMFPSMFPSMKRTITQMSDRCRRYIENSPANWDGVSYLPSSAKHPAQPDTIQ